MISVIVPCHNESGNIQKTYQTITNQTLKTIQLYFVDDASTDTTYAEIQALPQTKGITVHALKTETNLYRAGACNLALKQVTTKYVVMMDAGTTLEKHALEHAIKTLESNPNIGLVCSKAGVEKNGKGLLYRLQKLEYANTDLSRMITQNNVMISHGLFSATKKEIIKKVGYYSENMLLEDYDLTVKVKQLGYLAVFSPKICAYTETVKTIKQLIKQRYRWFIGGLDVLTKYGYTKATKEDIFGHALYLTFFMAIMGTLIFGFTFNNFQITYTNIMLIPIALATINYVTSLIGLSFVENLTKKDVVIRATILPELLYCIFLELVRWKAYLAKCFTKKRKW